MKYIIFDNTTRIITQLIFTYKNYSIIYPIYLILRLIRSGSIFIHDINILDVNINFNIIHCYIISIKKNFHNKRSLSSEDQNQFIDLATNFILDSPGVSSIGTRSVLDGDVDLGLCRELTVGDGYIKEQVLPSLERRSKKHRSILEATVCSSCYVLIVLSKGGKKMTARKRVSCPRLTYTARLDASQ